MADNHSISTKPRPLALKLIVLYIAILAILPFFGVAGLLVISVYPVLFGFGLISLIVWRLWTLKKEGASGTIIFMGLEIVLNFIIPWSSSEATLLFGQQHLRFVYSFINILVIIWLLKHRSVFTEGLGFFSFGSKKEWKIVAIVAVIIVTIFLLYWFRVF